ncbi:MAG: 2-oxoglutarate and iron-dependent oxygenase domain-containing protein [Dongiaceae bacterium]
MSEEHFHVDPALKLPVVDLTGLAEAADNADAAALAPLAAAFDHACRDHGFCYIAGHGVDPELRRQAFAMSAAFHALPLAEKQKLAINRAFRGYLAMATSVIVTSSIEKATRPNLSESLMVMHEVEPGAPPGALDGANQWPADLPGFRETIADYDRALRRLGRRMMRMIAAALGLPPTGLDAHFAHPTTFLRLLHYPPQPPDADAMQYGSAPHTDYGFITILAQDSSGGLQVRSREKSWIDATPIDDTFVVNIGDMGSRWSNGRWPSTPHRVVNRSGHDRYSLPYFFDPHTDTVVAPVAGCRRPGEPAMPPVRYGDYLMERIDKNYAYRKQASREGDRA